MFSLLLAVSTLAIAYGLYKVVLLVVPKPLSGIPTLPGTQLLVGDTAPLFAHYAETGQFHLWFEQRLREGKGGELGWLQMLWTGSLRNPSVVISDYREIEAILGRRHAEFDRSPNTRDMFRSLVPFGLLSIDADGMWKRHKRLIVHSLSPKSVRAMTPSIVSTARTLMDVWAAQLGESDEAEPVFEVERHLSAYTTDVISEVVFGSSYHQLDTALRQLNIAADGIVAAGPFEDGARMAQCGRIMFDAFPAEAIWPILAMTITRFTNSKIRNAERYFRAALKQKLAEARVRLGGGQPTLLDNMLLKELEDEQQEGSTAMSEQEMVDELETMLIAGDETTSSTLCWLLRFLPQHPDVQRRLHEEMKAVLPPRAEREVTADDLAQPTPYLDAVVQETLRLGKTASATYRTALIDTTLHGVPIPKGTVIILLIGYMGETGNGLDEPPADIESFRPERWLTPEGAFDAKAVPALPFSKGHRECIGKLLAMAELRAFTALLSQTFFLDALLAHVREREDGAIKEAVTRPPAGGVSVKLQKWEDL